MSNIKKQLEEIGYYCTKYNDGYNLTTLEDGVVLFDFFCDSEEEIREKLFKDINSFFFIYFKYILKFFSILYNYKVFRCYFTSKYRIINLMQERNRFDYF